MRLSPLFAALLVLPASAFAGNPEMVCSFFQNTPEKRMSGYQVHHLQMGRKMIARLSHYSAGALESTRTLSEVVQAWTDSELQNEKAFTAKILARGGVNPKNVRYAKSVAFGKDADADLLVNYLDANGEMIAGGVVTRSGIIQCHPLSKDPR